MSEIPKPVVKDGWLVVTPTSSANGGSLRIAAQHIRAILGQPKGIKPEGPTNIYLGGGDEEYFRVYDSAEDIIEALREAKRKEWNPDDMSQRPM